MKYLENGTLALIFAIFCVGFGHIIARLIIFLMR
jgi:hypothetical protein